MHGRIGRRAFLHGAGCAACAAAVGWHLPQATAQDLRAFERLDSAERLRLADLAMDLAKRAGASHADLRICRYRWQELNVRDGRLDKNDSGVSLGFGLRVLIGGAWGFAGAMIVDEAQIRRAAESAASNAAAMRRLGAQRVELETLDAHRADWVMPMRRDPLDVPETEKIDHLMAVDAAARKAGASYSSVWCDTVREEKFFANTAGSRINQTRTRIAPGFYITAVDKQTGKFDGVNSLASPRGAGWDYVEGLNLAASAEEAAEQAREKLAAASVTPGKYDLVIDATNLWLTVHESAGHSTELDRALGWEANYAGTSFVTPDKRGRLKYGSELMTVAADRTRADGLSTVAFDDDGVKTEGAEFTIIKNGVFQNYQMAAGQAHLIGEKRSNGCAYADGPMAFPLQRMPNISLLPNDKPTSRDDLIGGVENGILVLGTGSYSIDQQRHNFQFSGQLFYEIRNGKRGKMLRDAAYQGRTEAFWNSLDGLGDRTTHHLGGTFTCGKGEPGQMAPVSHGCVAGRFRGVDVLNTERSDI